MKSSASLGKLSTKAKKLAPLEDVQSGQMSVISNTTKSIQDKKGLVTAMRATNPASVNTAPAIFWDVEGALRTSAIDDSDVKQQMVIVENGVNFNIKRYNDLKVHNERLTKQLKARLDELEFQKKTFEQLDAMKKATTEEGIRIEGLHREIKQVEDDIRDRNHYSRKLDHMINRLKRNQLKFDAHMVGLEETMRSIRKEAMEIRLMRRALDAGLAKAVTVLTETKAALRVAQTDRKVLMEQREREYENAIVLEQWLKTRDRMKMELGIELRGELTIEDEMLLKSKIDERNETNKSLAKESTICQSKLQKMEEEFTRLKQVTGVKNVEEMHEKFLNQRTNKFQLDLEVDDVKKRLEQAKLAYQKVENDFKSLKSSGVGQEDLNRDGLDMFEKMSFEARTDQKAIKADAERIQNILLGLDQGSKGLLLRVSPYQQLIEGGVFDLTQVGEEASPWTETVEALNTAEHILSKMMELNQGDTATAAGGYDDDEDADSTYSKESETIETGLEAPNQTNNIRVKSRRYLRMHEMDDDVIIGDEGNNNKDADNDHQAFDAVVDEDADGARLHLRSASERLSQRETNRIEAESRRKKLLERIEQTKGTRDGGGAPGDDAKIGLTAKRKTQRAAAERLSVMSKVATLPEGVTLRDDPMTKTIAFLHADPGLA
jgi:hypothetical protein